MISVFEQYLNWLCGWCPGCCSNLKITLTGFLYNRCNHGLVLLIRIPLQGYFIGYILFDYCRKLSSLWQMQKQIPYSVISQLPCRWNEIPRVIPKKWQCVVGSRLSHTFGSSTDSAVMELGLAGENRRNLRGGWQSFGAIHLECRMKSPKLANSGKTTSQTTKYGVLRDVEFITIRWFLSKTGTLWPVLSLEPWISLIIWNRAG